MGCGEFVMAKKMTALRVHLRRWAKLSFGSIKLKKLDLLHELDKVDVLKESRRLEPREVQHEQDLRDKIGELLKFEEIYWKQRSRL